MPRTPVNFSIITLAVKRRLAGVGWWLLESRCRRRGQASQAELFADLWGFFRRFRFAFRIREYYSNPFRMPVENIVLCRIIRAVKNRFPGYKPNVRVINDGLIAKITDPTQRAVVVTIHNGISTSAIEILHLGGKPCSLVSVWSRGGRFFNILGSSADVRMIYPDQDVFLQARRHLHDGRVICCCPDTYVREQGTVPSRGLRIGKGIFEFARLMDARVYYALAQVSAAGEIVVQLDEPKCAIGSGAADMARDFISFLDSALTSGRRTVYSVG